MANTKEITINGRLVKADFDEHEIYVFQNEGEDFDDAGENFMERVNVTEDYFGDNDEFWALHNEVFGEDKESFEMESWNDYARETYLSVRIPSPNETYAWAGREESD